MLELYQQLRAAPTKAKALQAAQQALIQGKVSIKDNQLHWLGGQIDLLPELAGLNEHALSHPYYWSAFTLLGSPW